MPWSPCEGPLGLKDAISIQAVCHRRKISSGLLEAGCRVRLPLGPVTQGQRRVHAEDCRRRSGPCEGAMVSQMGLDMACGDTGGSFQVTLSKQHFHP